jgi:hypothetical protein
MYRLLYGKSTIVLEQIQYEDLGIEFMWLRTGRGAVLCEPSSSIKFGAFLDPLASSAS